MTQPARDSAPGERWQHGQAETVVLGRQQVARPVDALRARGTVGDAEVASATRYYGDWSFGAHGVAGEASSGAGGGADGYSIARIMALGRWADVRRHLGNATADVLTCHVLEERSIRSVSGTKTAARTARTKRLVSALTALTDHYAKLDGATPARASKIRAVSVDRSNTP